MGSASFRTGASGTVGSYFRPGPTGFHETSKLGIGLHVSCVHRSFASILRGAS